MRVARPSAVGSVGTVETRYPRPPEPGAARLRARAAPGPGRLRDLRRALPRARQRDPCLPRAERRRPRGRLLQARRRPRAPATGSAPRTATVTAGKGLGWWDGMIGPGKAFDTDRYFVVSTNLLGGCRGTTGPSSPDPATGRPYGPDFPVITVADMVRTERAFLDELGIERLAAVAGGSLGGMQAFEWAIMFPDQVDAIVAIASTHALQPAGRGVERDRPGGDHARPGLAGGPLLRHGRRPRRRHGRGAHDRPHHVPLGRRAARQVRPAAAVRRGHPLHDHRAGVRGRELSPPPGATRSSSASTRTPTSTRRGR